MMLVKLTVCSFITQRPCEPLNERIENLSSQLQGSFSLFRCHGRNAFIVFASYRTEFIPFIFGVHRIMRFFEYLIPMPEEPLPEHINERNVPFLL